MAAPQHQDMPAASPAVQSLVKLRFESVDLRQVVPRGNDVVNPGPTLTTCENPGPLCCTITKSNEKVHGPHPHCALSAPSLPESHRWYIPWAKLSVGSVGFQLYNHEVIRILTST